MYVMYADGNTMRKRDIRKAALNQGQNGKMYRMILNARSALWVRTNFQNNKMELKERLTDSGFYHSAVVCQSLYVN